MLAELLFEAIKVINAPPAIHRYKFICAILQRKLVLFPITISESEQLRPTAGDFACCDEIVTLLVESRVREIILDLSKKT